MHDSEYDSVVWDTKVAGDHEASSTLGATGSSPLANTHASAFVGMGDDIAQGGMDDGDSHSNNSRAGGAAFDVAYGGDAGRNSYAADGEASTSRVGQGTASANGSGERAPRGSENSGDVETNVTVDQPRKEGEGTNNPFITYLVTTTRTNQKTHEIRRYALRRRFQDFVWLHDQLTKQFIACVIPPLPGKHRMEYLTGDRFSEDFVGKRKHGLQRFLRRVLLHPSLQASQHLTVFLEAKDWSSEYEAKKPKDDSPGVLDSLGDTLLNTFSKARKRDDRFVEMRETVARLADNLTRTQKLYMRVTKRQQDLHHAYEELGTGMVDLGDIETGMTLGLVETGNALKAHHLALKRLAEQTEDLFLGEIEEYISYCEAYLEMLKLRDQKQAEFEDLTEFLQQTTAERDRLTNYQSAVGVTAVTNFIKGKVRDLRGVDPAISRQQRIERLAERIVELETAVGSSSQGLEAFSDLVIEDYEVFGYIRQHDFKRAFSALASSHIEFYSNAVDIWKAVIPELEKLPVD
ncbi:intercellular trafficking and secretion [Coemansia guatemalensis]|uniref:Sorting nexin-4 n=1 Tax=Coemansia guatemalensis TaxID=2761395 RepID=A0A9W8I5D7_9FUNG|nr:intercellular trafficking and secretion [Coemansia guatemalensis]